MTVVAFLIALCVFVVTLIAMLAHALDVLDGGLILGVTLSGMLQTYPKILLHNGR